MEGSPPAAATRRPRNRALSAFYKLPSASQDASSPQNPPGSTPSPADAEVRAADLIASAPLSKLLTSAAALRVQRDSARKTQTESVGRVYAQLEAASKLAERAAAAAEAAGAAVNGARKVAAAVAEVDEILAPARTQMDGLEDARTVDLLLAAAKLLETGVQEDYRAVVDLCLDPVGARERLLTTCLRYAALQEVFERCKGKPGSRFWDAVEGLERAVAAVREDLRQRMSEGGQGVDGLDLLHVVRVRLLLGDGAAELKLVFLRASEMSISAAEVSEAAAEAASASALSRATLELSFAERKTVPALMDTCSTYYSIFMEGVDTEATAANAEEFTIWLVQVVEHVVSDRVRKWLEQESSAATAPTSMLDESVSGTMLDESISGNISSPLVSFEDGGSGASGGVIGNDDEPDILGGFGTSGDAAGFRKEVEALRAAGKVGESNAVHGSGFAGIVSGVCDELVACATSTVIERARSHVTGRVRSILARDYARSSSGRISADVAGLLDLINGGQKCIGGVVAGLGGEVVELPRVVADYAIDRVNEAEAERGDEAVDSDDNLSRIFLSAAVVLDSISKHCASPGDDLAADLRNLRVQLLHSYCLRVAGDITEVLESGVFALVDFVPPSESPDEIAVGAKVSPAGCRAVSLLQRARRDVAAILSGTPHLNVAFGEEDEMLDEGGILQRVARGWVHSVREATLMNAKCVHALQVDAAALEGAIGFVDTFSSVPRAAVERCSTSVELLEPGEVARRIAATSELS